MDHLNRLILAILVLGTDLGERVRRRLDERGSVTTEQAIITAGVVVLALAAVGLLSSAVLAKIGKISLDSPTTTLP